MRDEHMAAAFRSRTSPQWPVAHSATFSCTVPRNGASWSLLDGRLTTIPKDERTAKLEDFSAGITTFSDALRKCPRHMWLRGTIPGIWSVHEIILHLADSEVESYSLFRQIIAEPGSVLSIHDLSAWAGSLGYSHQSPKEALRLFIRLRCATYQLLRSIRERVWSHVCRFSDNSRISLEQWLDFQRLHLSHHVEQIHQNHLAWVRTQPRRRRPRSARQGSVGKAPLYASTIGKPTP